MRGKDIVHDTKRNPKEKEASNFGREVPELKTEGASKTERIKRKEPKQVKSVNGSVRRTKEE